MNSPVAYRGDGSRTQPLGANLGGLQNCQPLGTLYHTAALAGVREACAPVTAAQACAAAQGTAPRALKELAMPLGQPSSCPRDPNRCQGVIVLFHTCRRKCIPFQSTENLR